jgi:4-amino-4-deoxy-L-arabinose transferase-like glycosyltransferase
MPRTSSRGIRKKGTVPFSAAEKGTVPFFLIPFLFLAAGLVLRANVFDLPHREGDERIYLALIEQVRAGHGYTLQGHPILEQDWMVREQYDTRVFYHPPLGIALMAILGPDVAQLAAFVVFFAATWALANEALPRCSRLTVAALAAATPIVAHVTTHRWLDGPQVAAVAVAAWLTTRALARGGTGAALGAGAAMGAAMLVKLNSAVAIPPIVLLAWTVSTGRPRGLRLRQIGWALGVAALCALPWIAIAPPWPGKPSARLIAENPFIRVVTVERTPWSYLRLLPTTVWSLVPSLAIAALLAPKGRERGIVWSLCAWIAIVTAVAMGLGALGYSKLLRYVVLTAPATVLLAGWAAGRVAEDRRSLAYVLAAALAIGCVLEVAHGVQVARVYPDRAWIRPLSSSWTP